MLYRPLRSTPAVHLKVLLVFTALFLVNLAIFAPVSHFDFVSYDDPQYVSENTHILGGISSSGVAWAFTSGYAANWHPLTWLSHMLDVQLYGLDAGSHHLTSVFLHVLNCWALFACLYLMTKSLGRSAFVAALFATHPLHVESVAWVAERKDVLSTLFGLLTLCAYVQYVRHPGRGRYILTAVLFGLGLLAKPMLVTLPFVMMLLDWWPLRRIASPLLGPAQRPVLVKLMLEKLPLIAMTVVSSVITIVVQHRGGAVQNFIEVPLNLRLCNAAVSYITYLTKTFWPGSLAIFYPFPNFIPAWKAVGSVLLLAGISVAVWRHAAQRPFLITGWFWYLGTLVPVIGLVQVGDQSMADRYSYIPLIGLFLIAAWGLPELLVQLWRPASKALPAMAAVLICACTLVARNQVQYWQNNAVVWKHALEVTTDNHFAHVHIGSALLAEGKPDEAISHYLEALRTRPNFDLALDNLAIVLLNQGKSTEALPLLLRAVQVNPSFADAQNNLAVALERAGKIDDAITHYNQAIRLDPALEVAHVNLAKLLATHGKVDEAVREYLEASRLKPDDALPHYDLGIIFNGKGDIHRAVAEFETAVRLKPGYAEAQRALMILSSSYRR
jgi:tetratricopeptide (TPR) repeat protein